MRVIPPVGASLEQGYTSPEVMGHIRNLMLEKGQTYLSQSQVEELSVTLGISTAELTPLVKTVQNRLTAETQQALNAQAAATAQVALVVIASTTPSPAHNVSAHPVGTATARQVGPTPEFANPIAAAFGPHAAQMHANGPADY